MSRRQEKLQAFIDFAWKLSQLSTCKVQKCGAIVFPANFSEVHGIGYNGQPMGRPNDACRGQQAGETYNLARCGCIHAEANLVARLGKLVRPAIMYSTTMPCEHCAGLIANSGQIAAVMWDNPYRDELGMHVLEDAGIVVRHRSDVQGMEAIIRAATR